MQYVDNMTPIIIGSDRSSRSHNLRSSVCPNLSEALNLNLFSSDSLQEHSESINQAFRVHSEYSESTQSIQRALREHSDCVIPSEPKILRLVPKVILQRI